jgi:hypothetical protein
METILKIYASAGVASVAAFSTCVINRLHNPVACAFATGAAITPWLVIVALWLWNYSSVLLAAPACYISLFLFTIYFYSADDPSNKRTIAVTLATLGLCSDIYFSINLIYPFLVT